MSIYDTLNDMQKEAVYHTEGPLLILAGAGSGKTRVLTHRIAYMIEEKGINPWNILAITFTNKAAGEMRDRVDKVVDIGADSVWVSTFHSTCVRILRRYIDRLGYNTNFTIYDMDDQKSVIKEICKRLNIDTKMLKERAIMSAISSAKDELISPDQMELNAGGDYNKKRIATIYREYQKALKLNNALDFDDLICKTVELFRSSSEVLAYYQERFKYIMVDEYQDTNTAQFMLISILADKYKNLCVVGDDDQSIYKFRGANIYNILDFEKTFPTAKVIKLEQNYRSSQTILDAANAVIKNNLGRKAKTLWTDNGEGEKINFTVYEDAYREAEGVVNDIRAKVRDGWNYNDCAILYRTNAQSRALEEKFVANNVPYRVFGGVNFYQRREIKDILAYLKTINNGMDGQAARRIINVPKRGIGATTIDRVQAYADEKEITFWDALVNAREITTLGRAYGKLEPFITYISSMRARAQFISIRELVETILRDTHYIEMLSENETREEVEARQENIDELINKVVSYEESSEGEKPTLGGFLEEVALIADIDNLDESVDRVMLMTLHSAKGLEFPIVYMTGLEDGLFPSYMTITSDDPTEIEEERRLCYVGITRAQKELNISAAKMRMVHGETQANKVSRFMKEVPSDLINITNSMVGGRSKITFGGDDANRTDVRSNAKSSLSRYSSGNVGFGKPFPSDIFDLQKSKGVAGANAQESLFGGHGSGLSESRAGAGTGGFSAGGAVGSSNGGVAGFSNGGATADSTGSLLGYSVGDRVRHVKFGEGDVQTIVNGGRDFEVTVEFEKAGVKKMFASFAKLKKI